MKELYIGVISGTSMDAVDIALVEMINGKLKFILAHEYPVPAKFSKRCKAITISETCSLKEFGSLDNEAGILFADAINKFLSDNNIKSSTISAIGLHGQTIKHHPELEFPFTMQIGDPNVVAYKTNIPVVADFRRKDMSAGGQGAPLAPILHQELFQTEQENRIILNIGGISNITVLPKDKQKPITGFDTGTGNCLMDAWCHKHFNKAFDKDGNLAKAGKVLDKLLAKMLEDPYFKLKAPKSTGTEYFNLKWLESILENYKKETGDKVEDNSFSQNMLTTLTHFSAKTIADEINNTNLENLKVYACGGGAHNKYLLSLINKYSNCEVETTEKLNLNPDWVEATLFAFLAYKRLRREKLELSSITGAKEQLLLGGVYS